MIGKDMAKKKASRKRTAKTSDAPGLKTVERPSHLGGIEQLVWVESSCFEENPENWKHHPKRQLDALDAEMDAVSYAGAWLYNKRTGHWLDGHGRSKTEFVEKTGVIPVLVGEWSEEQERQILLHLDPLAAMFETDTSAFKALKEKHDAAFAETVESLEADAVEALQDLDESLDIHATGIESGDVASFLPDYNLYNEVDNPSSTEYTGADAEEVDIEDTKGDVPGSFTLKTFDEIPANAWGQGGVFNIPALRPDMIPSLPEEFQTWVGPETPEADAYFFIYGCAAIEKVRSNKLVVGYYTYDRKFESVWNDPTKFTSRMINFNVMAAITPNYSPWEGTYGAFDIWQTFRSRWLGRYWQEAGLQVIPDITLSNLEEDARFKWRMTGLPKGLNCISVQVQQKGEADPKAYYARRRVYLLKVLKHLQPKQMILYHGPDLPKGWTEGLDTQVIPVKSWMSERGKVMSKKDYLGNE